MATEGLVAAGEASAAMRGLAESATGVTGAIETLAAKSERIGGIVDHDHRPRRADEPARAQRRDRGRPRR